MATIVQDRGGMSRGKNEVVSESLIQSLRMRQISLFPGSCSFHLSELCTHTPCSLSQVETEDRRVDFSRPAPHRFDPWVAIGTQRGGSTGNAWIGSVPRRGPDRTATPSES